MTRRHLPSDFPFLCFLPWGSHRLKRITICWWPMACGLDQAALEKTQYFRTKKKEKEDRKAECSPWMVMCVTVKTPDVSSRGSLLSCLSPRLSPALHPPRVQDPQVAGAASPPCLRQLRVARMLALSFLETLAALLSTSGRR